MKKDLNKKLAFTLAEGATHVENCRSRRRGAFTLAEVLITLAIIGIVAALTIPTLINNYQKKVTVTRLQQTYAMLSQAVKLSEIDNGPIETWNVPDVPWVSDNSVSADFAKKYIIPYLKVSQLCENNNNDKRCASSIGYYLDGTVISSAGNSHFFTFLLLNGTRVSVWPRGTTSGLIELAIDTNANMKPNIYGKDRFTINIFTKPNISNSAVVFGKIDKPGVYFYGYGHDREYLKTYGYSCSKNSADFAGVYCGALIQLDGWKISDDYPW